MARSDELKETLIAKLERCSWYNGSEALQHPNTAPNTPRVRFTTLFFSNSVDDDEQILTSFAEQLSQHDGIDVSSHDMDNGVIQLRIQFNTGTLNQDDFLEEARNINTQSPPSPRQT